MPVRDATGALVRAITDAIAAPVIEFAQIHSRDWVSGTLSATRHKLVLTIGGGEAEILADAFTDGIGEREFDLGRYILADIALVQTVRREDGVQLTLEALTVEGT